MIRSALLVPAAALVVSGLFAPAAFAAPPTGPDSDLCVKLRADLEVAIAGILDFNPNIYPGDAVPSAGDVDFVLLNRILGDPDLGGGARTEVEAVVVLAEKCNAACAPPAPTSTPAPSPTPTTPVPTTTTTPPTPTPVITLTPTATSTPTPAPAPTPAGSGQVRQVPRGGVDTGGGPA